MDMNLIQLMDEFGTEDECRKLLEELRWPNGVACPRCGDIKHQYDSKSHQYDCSGCGYKFTVTTGTMMHDTHLPLRKWFIATYVMCVSKKGISSRQLGKMLKVAHKTEWYLTHRIRAAMAEADPEMLHGIVEVDETYIGGKVRGKGRGYRGNKTMVLGAIQRGGDVRLRVAPGQKADRATLHGFIKSVVHDDAEAIHTDSWPAYQGIADANTRHETVDHNIDEWVRGDVTTNGIEGEWALFKRAIIGSYHQLSVKHLDAYLDEFAWRQNNRTNENLFFDTLTALLKADALPYSELTA